MASFDFSNVESKMAELRVCNLKRSLSGKLWVLPFPYLGEFTLHSALRNESTYTVSVEHKFYN